MGALNTPGKWQQLDISRAFIRFNNNTYRYPEEYQFDQNTPTSINKKDILSILKSLIPYNQMGRHILDFDTWQEYPLYSFDLTNDLQAGMDTVYERTVVSGHRALNLHMHQAIPNGTVRIKQEKYTKHIHVTMPGFQMSTV